MTTPLQVIAFPFAGGSSMSYAKIARALPAGVTMLTLDPPGHGRRMAQPLLASIEAMADDLLPAVLVQARHSPTILFGHSMGAYLAMAVLDRLVQAGAPLPLRLVLSGVAPPDRVQAEKISSLPAAEFLPRVVAMGGMPQAVLQEPELVELFGPILRAGFAAAEGYVDMRPRTHAVPVRILRGRQDRLAAAPAASWTACFGRPPQLLDFDGGHFFLFDQPAEVANALCADIASIDAATGNA